MDAVGGTWLVCHSAYPLLRPGSEGRVVSPKQPLSGHPEHQGSLTLADPEFSLPEFLDFITFWEDRFSHPTQEVSQFPNRVFYRALRCEVECRTFIAGI